MIAFPPVDSGSFAYGVVGFLACVGAVSILRLVGSVLKLAYENHIATGIQWGKLKGSYAVITGSTDGIGKEFAMQLACRHGMHLVLVSRTLSKLESVAKELAQQSPETKVRILAIDFAKASAEDYEALSRLVRSLDVSVLINNVAVSHAMPIPFVEEDPQVLENIIEVNVRATVKVTHCILPQLLERAAAARGVGGGGDNGLVLNIGSFAGLVPTAFLQTYSGSKAFLKAWSLALAREVKPLGVHVEHLNTYFVVSNMSKISRPSFLIPTAKAYVARALKCVGRTFDNTPYPTHNMMAWVFRTWMRQDTLIEKTYQMQKSIRQRALRKLERSQTSKKGSTKANKKE